MFIESCSISEDLIAYWQQSQHMRARTHSLTFYDVLKAMSQVAFFEIRSLTLQHPIIRLWMCVWLFVCIFFLFCLFWKLYTHSVFYTYSNVIGFISFSRRRSTTIEYCVNTISTQPSAENVNFKCKQYEIKMI